MDEQKIIDASVESGEVISCIAWDCIGRFSQAVDDTHLIRIVGGRTLYEDAQLAAGSRNTVRLARLATDPLHQINRYIGPDTKVELVPLKKSA
jgi:hypothetical protein